MGAPAMTETADLAGIAFLRPLFELAALGHPKPVSYTAIEATRLYDLAARAGWPLEFSQGPGPTLRSAVSEYVSKRGALIFADWSRLADRVGPVQRGECPHCDARTDISTWRVRAQEAELRHVTLCDNCGVIEDRPESLNLAFRMRSDHRLEQVGAPTGDEVSITLRMGRQDDARSITLPWPKDSEGQWTKGMVPTEGWAPGLMRLTLTVLSAASIGLYTILAAAPDSSLSPRTALKDRV